MTLNELITKLQSLQAEHGEKEAVQPPYGAGEEWWADVEPPWIDDFVRLEGTVENKKAQ